MAKQNLSKLLGLDEKRKQVELGLDEQVFAAQEVKAGTYGISGPVYAKTNSALQMAEALGRYAGPIAQGLGRLKDQREEEYEELASGLSPQVLTAIQNGDVSSVEDQFNASLENLDKAQRKKLIRFSENPTNYIRAYNVVGENASQTLYGDLLENTDQYSTKKDDNGDYIPPSAVIDEEIDRLANSLGTPQAVAAFRRDANRWKTGVTAKLLDEQDRVFQVEEKLKYSSLLTKNASNQNFTSFSDNFKAYTNGMDNAESYEFTTEFFTDLAQDNYGAASMLYAEIANSASPLELGIGLETETKEALIDDLSDILTEQAKNDIIEKDQTERLAISQLDDVYDRTVAAIGRGEDVGVIKLPSAIDAEEALEIDLTGVTSPEEIQSKMLEAYGSVEGDSATKDILATHISSLQESRAIEKGRFEQATGLSNLKANLTKDLSQNLNGVNIFQLDAAGVSTKVNELMQPYQEQITSIWNDPTKDIYTKIDEANTIIDQGTLIVTGQVNEMYGSNLQAQANESYVNDLLNGAFVTDIANSFYEASLGSGRGLEDESKAVAFDQGQEYVNQIRPQALDILNAPIEEELAAGKTITQIYEERQNKVDVLVQRAAYAAEELYSGGEAELPKQDSEDVPTTEVELNTTGTYVPEGSASTSRNSDRTESSEFRTYKKRKTSWTKSQETANDYGFGSYREYLKATMDGDTDQFGVGITQHKSVLTGKSFVTYNNSFYQRGHVRYYEDLAFENLNGDKPVFTVEELQSGGDGFLPTSSIDPNHVVVLSPSMVINQDGEYDDQIKAYAVALGMEDLSDDSLNAFVTRQAVLMQQEFGLNIFNNSK